MYNVCKQFVSDNNRLIITFILCKIIHILNFFVCKQIWHYMYVKESCEFGYIYLLSVISFFVCFIFMFIIERLMMVKKITVWHMTYRTIMILSIMGENILLFLSYMFYIGFNEIKYCSPNGEPLILAIVYGIYGFFFFIGGMLFCNKIHDRMVQK